MRLNRAVRKVVEEMLEEEEIDQPGHTQKLIDRVQNLTGQRLDGRKAAYLGNDAIVEIQKRGIIK